MKCVKNYLFALIVVIAPTQMALNCNSAETKTDATVWIDSDGDGVWDQDDEMPYGCGAYPYLNCFFTCGALDLLCDLEGGCFTYPAGNVGPHPGSGNCVQDPVTGACTPTCKGYCATAGVLGCI